LRVVKRRDTIQRMKRRTALRSIAGIATASAAQAEPGNSIQLHTDLAVPSEKEASLLADFEKRFLPLIRKAPGFIDAKLLKFRQANVGKAPERYNYRLVQIFESEEKREVWTKNPAHKIAWHEALEPYVQTPFVAYLYDIRVEGRRTNA